MSAVAERVDDWMERGACVGTPPHLFFSELLEEIEHAKSICAVCPVELECREYAQQTRPSGGVWGGMSESERRGTHRRELRAARVVASPPRSVCPGCHKAGTTVPVGGGYGECVSCKARYPWPA